MWLILADARLVISVANIAFVTICLLTVFNVDVEGNTFILKGFGSGRYISADYIMLIYHWQFAAWRGK